MLCTGHDGNPQPEIDPKEQVSYSYNAQNRLIQAITSGISGINTVEYAYDADGIRIQKILNGTEVVKYLVDYNRPYAQVLEEHTGAGDLLASYVYGDDLISQTRPSAGSGAVTSYYLYDGLGSTRALTDPSGMVTDTYTYDAFGNLLDKSGTTPNTYLFTGEQHDPNLGFYYLRARYMNPSSGRFMTTDLFEGSPSEPATLHKYLYAGANPISYVDPSGYAFTLNELKTTEGIQNIMFKGFKVMDRIFEFYDTAQTMMDYYSYAKTFARLFRALAYTGDAPIAVIQNEIAKAFGVSSASGVVTTLVSGFNDAFTCVGRQKLQRAFHRFKEQSLLDITTTFAKAVMFTGKRMKDWKQYGVSFVLYAPNGTGPRPGDDTYIPAGPDLKIGVNVGGGRLFGFGVQVKKARKKPEQLFRVDYWDYHTLPIGLRFHYHLVDETGETDNAHHYF